MLMRIFILLLLLSANAAGAEIHKWRDADGKLHFGDQPPANADSQRVEVKPNVYTAQQSSSEQGSPTIPSKPSVTLYSTTWCGYCRKARDFFRANNIPFKEYDVETSRKGKADYARFGANGVPVILVGNQRLQGFAVEAFKRAYAQR